MNQSLFLIAAALLLGAAPLPTRERLAPTYRDDNDGFDETDLSFIKKFAAVGDSYSAGIGAGNRLGSLADWACSRYDHAYPNLINQDESLRDPKNRQFEFHSCSGAAIQRIIQDQLPYVSSNQDVITLSAGGNDAELANILNHLQDMGCPIYWNNIGRACVKQLSVSRAILESDGFHQRLESVIAATKEKLSDSGILYYTGYAKFFGTDLDPACDDVTWSVWFFKSLFTFFLKKQLLTRDNRKQMNDLAAAVARAGSQVEFVDYDDHVGMYGGRYCEPGVDESTVEGNTRVGLMFFKLNTMDPFGRDPWKRSAGEYQAGILAGHGNLLSGMTEYVNPYDMLTLGDSVDDRGGGAAQDVGSHPPLVARSIVPNILPDGYGRTFHPQILLHEIIAKQILWRLTSRLAQQREWDNVFEVVYTPQSCLASTEDNIYY